MHAVHMLESGHLLVMDSFVGLPESVYETGAVGGEWSVKEIIAHLAAYESLLVDVLSSVYESDQSTPVLERWLLDPQQFDEDEVTARRDASVEELIAEYAEAHTMVIDLLIHIPCTKMRERGLLDWYGEEYDLEDFLVYTYYAHKREQCAQVNAFKERFEQENALQMVLSHI